MYVSVPCPEGFRAIWFLMAESLGSTCSFRYLFATKRQEIRIFCNDGLGQMPFTEVCQLSISFIWSHNTVHPSRPGSLDQKSEDSSWM